jgi:MraZ protein
VPAAFRAALDAEAFQGAVALRSYSVPAVEMFGGSVMERLVAQVDRMDMFSEERQNFTATLFADSELLSFDSEGRIVLSDALLSHAQIHDQVAFVGCGTHFQIWKPEFFAGVRESARQKLKNDGLALPLKELRALPKGEQ